MQIDKSQILGLLSGDKASQADRELPDKVDTDQHGGILAKLGLNPADLLKMFGGGGSGGGLGGLLGR